MSDFFVAFHWYYGNRKTDDPIDISSIAQGQVEFESPYGNMKFRWNHFGGCPTIDIGCSQFWRVILAGNPIISNEEKPCLANEIARLLDENQPIDVLKKMEGSFVAIFWNQTNGEVDIATDRVGNDQCFYHFEKKEQKLYCASSPSIIANMLGSVELDREALNIYLGLKGVMAPWTLLTGISKVKPGKILKFFGEMIEEDEYWLITSASISTYKGDFSQAKKDLLASIEKDIRKYHTEQENPIGVFLSGGLDSSAIAALAHQMKLPLTAYTVGYTPFYRTDETRFAHLVAEEIRIPHLIEKVSIEDISELIPKVVPLLTEPIADLSFWPQLLLAKRIPPGTKVVLDGTGADMVFGVSNKTIAMGYSHLYNRLPHWFRHYMLVPFSNLFPSSRQWKLTNQIRKLQAFLHGAELPEKERMVYWLQLIPHNVLTKLLKEEWTLSEDIVDNEICGVEHYFDSDHSLSAQSYLILKYIQPWVELLKHAAIERITGISIHKPFLSPALIELAFSFPDQYKVDRGSSKYILRKTVEAYCPELALKRPKANFNPPDYLTNNSRLRENFLDIIQNSSIFNTISVMNLFREQESGWRDWQSELWAIYMVQTWWDSISQGKSLL